MNLIIQVQEQGMVDFRNYFKLVGGRYTYLLLFLLCLGCNTATDTKSSERYNLSTTLSDNQLNIMLYKYLDGLSNDSVVDSQYFTDDNLLFTKYPSAFIYDVVKQADELSPKILEKNFNKSNDTLLFSFTIGKNDTNLFSLGLTTENSKACFISPLFLNSQKLNKVNFNNIEYFYPKQHDFNEVKALQMCQFDSLLSKVFKQNQFSYKYFIFDDITKAYQNEYSLHKGDYYKLTTKYNQKNTAYVETRNFIIFTGNSSEVYKHELVHLYTAKWDQMYRNPNRWFSEGLATFFGGHMGYTFEEQLCFVKEYLDTSKIQRDSFNITSIPLILSEKTKSSYVFGGLICKITIEKHGIEGVKKLFTYPRSREGLFNGIHEVLGMTENEINDLIYSHINNLSC